MISLEFISCRPKAGQRSGSQVNNNAGSSQQKEGKNPASHLMLSLKNMLRLETSTSLIN